MSYINKTLQNSHYILPLHACAVQGAIFSYSFIFYLLLIYLCPHLLPPHDFLVPLCTLHIFLTHTQRCQSQTFTNTFGKKKQRKNKNPLQAVLQSEGLHYITCNDLCFPLFFHRQDLLKRHKLFTQVQPFTFQAVCIRMSSIDVTGQFAVAFVRHCAGA